MARALSQSARPAAYATEGFTPEEIAKFNEGMRFLSACSGAAAREEEQKSGLLDFTAATAITGPAPSVAAAGAAGFQARNPLNSSRSERSAASLRTTVINHLKKRSIAADENTLVLNTLGIFATIDFLLAELKTDIKVILPVPNFGHYFNQCKKENIPVVKLQTKTENLGKITAQELLTCLRAQAEKLSPHDRTKRDKVFLIFTNPTNPLGGAYSEREINELSAVIARFPWLTVINDEAMIEVRHTREPIYSLGQKERIADQVITLRNLNKSRGVTQTPCAYGKAPQRIIEKLPIQISGLSYPTQRLISVALENTTENSKYLTEVNHLFSENLLLLEQAIAATNLHITNPRYKISSIKPEAGSVCIIRFKNWHEKIRDSISLSTDLLSGRHIKQHYSALKNLAVVPGEAFFMNGQDMYLRFPLSRPVEEIREAFQTIVTEAGFLGIVPMSHLKQPAKKTAEPETDSGHSSRSGSSPSTPTLPPAAWTSRSRQHSPQSSDRNASLYRI